MPNDKRFRCVLCKWYKMQSQVQTKLFDLIKFDYVLKTTNLEKTPMTIYDLKF